jgi:hypothetical protein
VSIATSRARPAIGHEGGLDHSYLRRLDDTSAVGPGWANTDRRRFFTYRDGGKMSGAKDRQPSS